MYRWIGAALIIGSCGTWGLRLAAAQLQEEAMVRALLRMIAAIRWELEYRITPLPELIHHASSEMHGNLHRVMLRFEENLRNLSLPDAGSCMTLAVSEELPKGIRELLHLLGISLGRYDLSGQLEGLKAVEEACHSRGEELKQERDARLHSFRILGFCAGIALAVLLV